MNRSIAAAAVAAGVLLLVPGCENKATPQKTAGTPAPVITPAKKGVGGVTPLDQSQASADIKTTADIRSAIMDDKSMSINAQNCKIITEKSGMVTLWGVVDSQAEKDSIESKAKLIAGAAKVVNQLELKTK